MYFMALVAVTTLQIVCRVAYFSFLAGIRQVALSSFAYCQNRFYQILIDVFPVWSVVAMYFCLLYS